MKEDEAMRRDFQMQLERLRAREAIITNTSFNEGLYKQRNPSMKNAKIKNLLAAVSIARRIREKDLEEL